MFSSTPGFYPLDASNAHATTSLVITTKIAPDFPDVPWQAESPPLENHRPKYRGQEGLL